MKGLETLVADQDLATVMTRVRKRVRATLALRSLTQEAAGDEVGLSKTQVSGMMNAGNPTLRTMLVLAKMSGMPLERLVSEMPGELEGSPGTPQG